MSENINDTDTKIIRSQVDSLLNVLKTQNSPITEEREYELSKQYSYLYNTSKTLFKFILNNYKSKQNQSFFTTTIKLMLDNIEDIQNGKISQTKASGVIGTRLAKEYINVCK